MNRIPAHIELHKQPLDSGKSNPEKKYASIVKILAKNNGVVQPIGKKGFGRTGLYFNGRLFAFLSHKKQLVVKLGPKRVMVLVAEDKGIYWDPKRDGPVLKRWIVLNPPSDRDWLPLAREALKLARLIE